MNIDKDSFSSGQISSKIWLCEELENTNWSSRMTYVYGGWQGIMGFLLLSRNKFVVTSIRSIDSNPDCQVIADIVNENWVWQNWKFKAFTADCNTFEPVYGDLVINTSTEHFDSKQWFDNIPKGVRVALQGNNAPHDQSTSHVETHYDFMKDYPLSSYQFSGEKEFVYPNWSFTRYMIIGVK